MKISIKTTDAAGNAVDLGWGAAQGAPTPSPAYLEFITVGEDGQLAWDFEAAAAAGLNLTEAQIAATLAAAEAQRTTTYTKTTTTTTTTGGGGDGGQGSASLSFGTAGGDESKKATLSVRNDLDGQNNDFGCQSSVMILILTFFLFSFLQPFSIHSSGASRKEKTLPIVPTSIWPSRTSTKPARSASDGSSPTNQHRVLPF